jgi:hypothetical protein
MGACELAPAPVDILIAEDDVLAEDPALPPGRVPSTAWRSPLEQALGPGHPWPAAIRYGYNTAWFGMPESPRLAVLTLTVGSTVGQTVGPKMRDLWGRSRAPRASRGPPGGSTSNGALP